MKNKLKKFEKLFKNKKTLILTLLIVALTGISVGYSAISTYLNIQGYAVVDIPYWSVIFDNLDEAVLTGRAYEDIAPVITDSKTQIGTYNVIFSEPGDSISYSFDVINEGDLNAYLSLINVSEPVCSGAGDNASADAEYVCSHLNYSLTYEDGHELEINDTLNSGTSKRLKLTLSYDDPASAGVLPMDDVNISNLDVTLVYSQGEVSQKETYKLTIDPDPLDSHVIIKVADMVIKEGSGRQTITIATGLGANYSVSKDGYDTVEDTYIMGNGNHTINVKLEETAKYDISFNKNGGSGGQSSTVQASYEEPLPSISTTKPTRSGYTFMGWYDGTNYTTAKQYYDANGSPTIIYDKESDITLYAGWKANTYTITFDANGGTVGTTSKTVTYDSAVGELPVPTPPANTNAVFIGWFDNSNTKHNDSYTYKDYPIYFYADNYSDLYNNYGYDQTLLYNHYISSGSSENRITSQYISTTTMQTASNTTLYAGWIYRWQKYSANIAWDENLVVSDFSQTLSIATFATHAKSKAELDGLIEWGLSGNNTIDWSTLPSAQQQKVISVAGHVPVAGEYYCSNADNMKAENPSNLDKLLYSRYYALIKSRSGTLQAKVVIDIYEVSNVRVSKGNTYYGYAYNSNSTYYPNDGYSKKYWYVK